MDTPRSCQPSLWAAAVVLLAIVSNGESAAASIHPSTDSAARDRAVRVAALPLTRAGAQPGRESGRDGRPLTLTAVHTSYLLGDAASDTITTTVTQTVRWDLVKIVQHAVLAGGEDAAKDAATGDTIVLTGSGDARPGAGNAAGGGTFVFRHHASRDREDRHGDDRKDRHSDDRDETEFHGIYLITGFVDWKPGDGQLAIADGIGRSAEASAGILTLSARFFASGGDQQDGVLTVHARLPNETFDIEQGITLAVDGFFFVQERGAALFHVQK